MIISKRIYLLLKIKKKLFSTKFEYPLNNNIFKYIQVGW